MAAADPPNKLRTLKPARQNGLFRQTTNGGMVVTTDIDLTFFIHYLTLSPTIGLTAAFFDKKALE